MEDKFLLNDDELDNVVGGFAEKGIIRDAFWTAMDRFDNLTRDYRTNYQLSNVFSEMSNECERTQFIIDHPDEDAVEPGINYQIYKLETLYTQVVSCNVPQASDGARKAIDELKNKLGL